MTSNAYKFNPQVHNRFANCIRSLSIDAVEKAKSGHPGMPLGMADVATVLFTHFLKFSPTHPSWEDRDRFVLSAGHGSMLLYSLLYLTGYKDMTIDEIKRFRQLNSKTPGHPEYGMTSGVEVTTGPLSQGFAHAVGMALGEEILRARFGESAQNHYTYVFAGDGCLMEGLSQEALSFAGHLKLSKLIVFWDNNGITIDGSTSLSTSDNHLLRFQASGWNTISIDGHNTSEIFEAIQAARDSDKPTLIACKTQIGFGSPHKAGSEKAHGSPLGEQEALLTKKALGIDYDSFEIPENDLEKWRMFGRRHEETYLAWENNCPENFKTFMRTKKINFEPLTFLMDQWMQDKPSLATRSALGDVLETMIHANPQLIGGSADLTPSNNTRSERMMDITSLDKQGNYIRYGIREHLMAACMNGLALHGGMIPYGGTFLCFTDYMRPAIRLSALMELKVIYVMTHDSIGLGEDGPTHQPVEHLSSLRLIPNLRVYRPCDALETAHCFQSALEFQGPSILSLSRQSLPFVHEMNQGMLSAYILRDQGEITFVSSGSEVSLCLKAANLLFEKHEIKARVVSIPCHELFEEMEEEEKFAILGRYPVLAVEAAVESAFWIKHSVQFLGLRTFGASAPCEDVYAFFGLTPENIMNHALSLLGRG